MTKEPKTYKIKRVENLTYQPKERGIYMFNEYYAGSSLVYYKSHKDYHEFVFLPGPSEFFLTFEEFTKAIKHNILELAESLPENVYQETIKMYLTCPKQT